MFRQENSKNELLDIEVIPDQGIILSDGTRLSAKVWRPKDYNKKKYPVILEYIPYRKTDGTQVRDAVTHPYFSERGYICLRVDLRGNGDSEGLLFDEYTETELSDAEEVISWAASQSWSNGNVGMMGISWGGFNSLQVAARNPKALKAIITLCSTVNRYTDDIHYKGGCLLNENLGWGATMLSFSSRPPDPLFVGERWRELWLERLDQQPHLSPIWLQHQSRDEYWKHGSICEDYSKIEAPTLAIGGWGDAYKNAVPALLENLSCPKKGIIGPWVHKYPHFAVPEPRIGFLQETLRWWDKWLKNID
ncbi:MAG: CocE/NonD family hydrolase, partial [Pseudomonadota bacterium]|nr:CocE/NonD family hydrolase [Pseudomonadota bacterium]